MPANSTLHRTLLSLSSLLLTLPLSEQSFAINPLPGFQQQTKILATDGMANDSFAKSIASSGDNVIIGAQNHNNTGTAYIYNKNQYGSNHWGEVSKLSPIDTFAGQLFASSVAIDHDIAVIGAKADNEAGTDAGAAYVYYFEQGQWVEIAKLTGDNTTTGDRFGSSVTISADIIAVGAINHDANQLKNSGAVYIFSRHQGGTDNWGQVAMLSDALGQENDHFGFAIDIDDDTLVIGAHNKDIVSSNNILYPINYHPQLPETGPQPRFTFGKLDAGFCGEDGGSAFIFQAQPGNPQQWHQVTQITASIGECSDHFGEQLAISGDTIVAGVPSKDIFDRLFAGMVFVYERHHGGENAWGEVAMLETLDGREDDHFGSSVDIDGDSIAAGAETQDAAGFNSGSAYIFQRDEQNQWSQQRHLTSYDLSRQDRLGSSISITGNNVISGAIRQASSGNLAGAAYVFHDADHMPAAASYTPGSGELRISAVDVPGMGLFSALLKQASDGSFKFTLQQLTALGSANSVMANYFAEQQILYLPSVSVGVDNPYNNYTVDLKLLPNVSPTTFELSRVR